ncbi:MAG: phosphate regulon transcriptional regulator PhoB [Thiofilum sp.]|nr:phosphate regulon transcriptional regulator PhoB [Thiofilum sp.]MBK8453632.1 phosphate regulon transcriptional regulator PhoB [Thiofilum sp.]
MNTVLIIEDEAPIRQLVAYTLERVGHTLLEADCGRAAQEILAQQQPDMILMDWMLPDLTGLELTRRFKRHVNLSHIPIIMLTARADEADKIAGLNSGADDYMSKPFSPAELLARMRAVWRRVQPQLPPATLTCRDLTLDIHSHRVYIGHETLDLGPTEFRLLKFFLQHPERVYSREQLLKQAWGPSVYVEERTVDVHILRLRKILMPFGYDDFIQTVRGAGYRFSPTTPV